MKSRNKKLILGILSLGLFVFILFKLSGGIDITRYKYLAEKYWKELTGRNGGITREVNKLVEEESAITAVVESASPSVVSIVVETVDFDFFSGPSLSEEGIGTGFIVDSSGLIVTNRHVVSADGDYSVVLKDGTTYEVEAIHSDTVSDLAILEITARGLPALELADSDSLKVGQTAIAIGNALGKFQNTVTRGIVSGVSREIVASSGLGGPSTFYEEVIQTDAALNPGNSGGPLLNLSGQVMGINVATTPNADNISFAIPANTLRPVLEGFLANGRIVRPYLGVSYRMITEEVANLRGLPQGAYISRVYSDSPAEDADLERGDVIVQMDGEQLGADYTLSRAIADHSVGDTVELRIDRDGESVTAYAVLAEVPDTLAN